MGAQPFGRRADERRGCVHAAREWCGSRSCAAN